MRTLLAERLLVASMDWDPEKVSEERPLLQALANYKYNEYQQYSPGMRFIGSLVRWLDQFDQEDKNVAYEFIKKELIFFSGEQILHLVSLLFDEKIRPVLIEKTANQLQLNKYEVHRIVGSEEYKKNLRQSLFIGLSDGSKIDQFRRGNSLISNEQVSTTYDISESKAKDMIDELVKDMGETKFTSVFLIDDFTASGTSYFRRTPDNKYAGKVCKFLKKLLDDNSEDSYEDTQSLNSMVDPNELTIHLLFYIATEEAVENIRARMQNWLQNYGLSIEINIEVLQKIPRTVKGKLLANESLINIAKKYFDKTIVNRHFKKAKCEEPYLGYNEGGLPLILNHNTPNNSLPLLWSDSPNSKGLFPRITRHKS